jgi:hypothetical protein
MSNAVTVKLHVAVFPEVSVAVQVTVVVPSGTLEPDAGLQATVTPGQLSEATGAGYVMITLDAPFGVTAVTFAGHMITGGCVSFTVMVNVQVAVLPAASVAVPVTVVTPFGKVEPDGGEATRVGTEQLSVAVGA